jgi:hypothetical protein
LIVWLRSYIDPIKSLRPGFDNGVYCSILRGYIDDD